MYCKHCGGENRPGDRFCRTCGAALDGAETPAPEMPEVSTPEYEPELVLVTFDESPIPSPAAPELPEGAVGVLTADRDTPEDTAPTDAPVPSDPEPLTEEDARPMDMPPAHDGRRAGELACALALSLPLFLLLGAAAFSLALLLSGREAVMLALASSLPAPLLALQLTAAAAGMPGAVGLILLLLAAFCWLLKTSGRPALSFRCLGGAAALGGGAMVLTGLFFERWALLSPAVTAALTEDGILRGRCFVIGFILIIGGLVMLIATLPIRRAARSRQGMLYRGGLQLAATLGLTAAAVLLTVGICSAMQYAVPAEAAPEYPMPTQAEAALEAGDYRAALELVTPDAVAGVGAAEDCLLAAQALRGLDDRGAAMATLRTALSAHPNDAALCAELADVLTELGNEAAAQARTSPVKAKEAATYYRESLIYAPGNTSVRLAVEALEALWAGPDKESPAR